MRYRRQLFIHLSNELLLQTIAAGCGYNLPEDTMIINVVHKPMSGETYIIIESDEFPELHETEEVLQRWES